MTVTECPHGDVAELCPPCQRAPHMLDAPPDVSRPFAARFEGVCAGCDGPVSLGERIRRCEREDSVQFRHDDAACIPEE